MTPEQAAKFLESDKLFLDPHEYRRWVCPWCDVPSVRLSPFNHEGNYFAFCGLDYGHVHMPFLPARIEGRELVVITLDGDLRMPEYFDQGWNVLMRLVDWIRRKLDARN